MLLGKWAKLFVLFTTKLVKGQGTQPFTITGVCSATIGFILLATKLGKGQGTQPYRMALLIIKIRLNLSYFSQQSEREGRPTNVFEHFGNT